MLSCRNIPITLIDRDPEKQAETMRATCPFCGNPFAEHSIEDHKACAEKQKQAGRAR